MSYSSNPAVAAATSAYRVTRRDPSVRAVQWTMSAPLRWYLRSFPVKRGKGIVHAILGRTVMRDPELLDVRLPCGASLEISTGEVIGWNLAVRGEFETAELAACSRLARRGTMAVDVGANVGIFTLTLAQAVGPAGRVLAFEPLTYNHRRLVSNIERNGFRHVDAELAAVGAARGHVKLPTGGDPAYVSLRGRRVGDSAGIDTVVVRTLDDTWRAAGQPEVSFVKIDVEGLEPAVIAGAAEMIAACRPHLLVEAPTEELRVEVSRALAKYALEPRQPPGFEAWNYLFGP